MGASPIAYSRAIFGWFSAHRGRALGVMLAVASLSGVALPPAGPILLGRAFDATGSYAAAMSQLGAITLIAAALMLTFPRLPRPSHV